MATIRAATNRICHELEHTDPLVVGIAGASASGKSHLANELQHTLEAANVLATIVHLDDFSIGKNFKQKDTSRYRWDDPEYYRLAECRHAIEELKNNRPFSFLAYNLRDHDTQQTKTLGPLPGGPKNVIILEGIFAWYPPLAEIVDLKIFTSANFFVRFVLRANRNVNLIKNTDFNTVVKQYFSHVMYAERDLIAPLADAADLSIPLKIDIAELLRKAPKLPRPTYDHQQARTLYKDDTVEVVVRPASDGYRMTVLLEGGALFDEPLNTANIELLQKEKFITKNAGNDRIVNQLNEGYVHE